MADSNYSNSSEDKGLAQDDPFAELTRIMGHDPRPVRKPEPAKDDSANDLALELENELMGNLTDDDEAETTQAAGEDAASADDGGHWPPSDEPLEEPQTQEDFDPSQLSAIFEEAFGDHLTREASSEAAPREVDEPSSGEEGFSASGQEAASYDPAFDAPHEAGTRNEDDGQPMRFVSFRNTAPLIPALAAARQPATSRGEEHFAPRWDDPDLQPQAGEDETPVADAGAPEGWHGEETGQDSEMEFSQPEVDTVDVPGEKIAATDNLDLPDVRYGEETAKSELDEIEELLAGAFSAPGRETEPPQFAGASEDEGRDSAAASMAATDWTFDEEPNDFADRQQTGPSQDDDEFAFDSLDNLHSQHSNHMASGREAGAAAMAPAPGARPPRKAARRSGKGALWASAAVLCLLLAGGAAMYFGVGGDADSSAVIVQADDEPVKIKPEDPGGTTIPNQDNQVYKRVSGEDAQPEPSETRLVSTTEEPMDLPGVQDVRGGEPEGAASDTGQEAQAASTQPGETPAKIDERLQNTIAEEPAEEEVAALEPRRVRSLVVRPDGSMVPREMPEPETANPAAQASQNGPAGESGEQQTAAASTESGTQPAAEVAQSETTANASETETAAAVPQPENVPVPVSRPANLEPATQAQEPAAAPQPEAPETQVAAASPQPAQPAASAPTSEWSVQIASQPSVEGAQQSYQQLAQRYGNLLQGRGVNIIKADITGKGTYYRVRIPSSSKDDAIRLCEQLKSAGGNCFVSK